MSDEYEAAPEDAVDLEVPGEVAEILDADDGYQDELDADDFDPADPGIPGDYDGRAANYVATVEAEAQRKIAEAEARVRQAERKAEWEARQRVKAQKSKWVAEAE